MAKTLNVKKTPFDLYVDTLNRVNCNGFEDVKLGELFSTLYVNKDVINIKNLVKKVAFIFKWRLWSRRVQGAGTKLFIFSHSYYDRADLFHGFLNAVHCCEDSVCYSPRQAQKNLKLPLKDTRKILYWFKSLRKCEFSFSFTFFLALELYMCEDLAKQIMSDIYNAGNINLVTVLCDVHPVDYYIIHLCNKMNIKTATLQHGVFDHYSLNGYEFVFSHSNDFLAMNQYAIDEAIKSGCNTSRYRILGPLSYIGKDISCVPLKLNKHMFGVLLHGKMFEGDKEDERLLDFGEIIINEFGLNVRVRPHPRTNIPSHSIKKCKNYYESDIGESLDCFFEKCDFVICGYTTAFMDSLIDGTLVFRYCGSHDYYEQVRGLKFQSKEDLIEVLKSLYDNNYDDIVNQFNEARNYFLPDGDIKINYENYFNLRD